MILALFGTSHLSFSRLAKAVESYAQTCDEKIIAQIGNTSYHPKGVECFYFLSRQELLKLIDTAEIVITQGGFGSIMDCLERGRKIVAVPRKQQLGECRHGGMGQEELVRHLDEQGRLVGVFDIENLTSAIDKARGLKAGREADTRIPQLVYEFVQSVIGVESSLVEMDKSDSKVTTKV